MVSAFVVPLISGKRSGLNREKLVLLEFRHLLPLDNEALVDHAIPVILLPN